MVLDLPDPQTFRGLRDRAIFELMYATGMRVGELVGLNVQDVSLEDRLVRILGKGRKERIVPFGEKARQSVQNYLRRRRLEVRSKGSAADAGSPFFECSSQPAHHPAPSREI